MNWLILLLILTIPAMGIRDIYVAYRIWFRSDYSYLKNNDGEIPENPEALGKLVAKVYLGTGVLVLIVCVLALPKVSLTTFGALITIIFAVFRIAMSKLVREWP